MVKNTRKAESSNLEMLKSSTKIGIIDESEERKKKKRRKFPFESIAGRELE